jgi:hypothetical protein
MNMVGGNNVLEVTWTDYREFRTDVAVVEIEGDDGYVAPQKLITAKSAWAPEGRTEVMVSVTEQLSSSVLLNPAETKGRKVKFKRSWWRFLLPITASVK